MHLVDPTLAVTAGGAVAVLLAMWIVVRRRRVPVPQGMLVLPHVAMPSARRRLAKGSMGYAGVDAKPGLRPTHAASASASVSRRAF